MAREVVSTYKVERVEEELQRIDKEDLEVEWTDREVKNHVWVKAIG